MNWTIGLTFDLRMQANGLAPCMHSRHFKLGGAGMKLREGKNSYKTQLFTIKIVREPG